MKEEALLTTTKLAVGFTTRKGASRLFENLDLSLYPGQLVCFMGPNGVGKSSLIRTLSGLQTQLHGYTTLHGITDLPRQIAVVLTDKVAGTNMSVRDVVAFGRYPYLNWNISLGPADREVIDRAIDMVHIGHLADQNINSLSDGQLQMTMIARALAQDTPIIMLDEPTAHLDLNNRVEIMRLLRSLSEKMKKAVLIATHELDLALQMADQIWLAGQDKNIRTGCPEDLVLNGAFDEVFQLKGFDLRTGKIQHPVTRQDTVVIDGEGFEYLWTRNALQRKGFGISDEAGDVTVSIIKEGNLPHWRVDRRGEHYTCATIEKLINSL